MIHDLDIAKEAFLDMKNEIAGRVEFKLCQLCNSFKLKLIIFLVTEIFQDGEIDIVLTDYGPTWESLRRVTHAAVRKFANDEKLAFLVNDVVGETIETIKKEEGINKPFNPVNYIYLTVFNILASSAFGKRYSMNDEEFLKLKNLLENATESFTGIVVQRC